MCKAALSELGINELNSYKIDFIKFYIFEEIVFSVSSNRTKNARLRQDHEKNTSMKPTKIECANEVMHTLHTS